MPERWVSIGEAAVYAGVSTKTIRRRITDGSLPAGRLGSRIIRVSLNDVDSLFTPIDDVS